jgi:hypothetical protein
MSTPSGSARMNIYPLSAGANELSGLPGTFLFTNVPICEVII